MLHYLGTTGLLLVTVDTRSRGPSELELADELQQLDAEVARLYDSSGAVHPEPQLVVTPQPQPAAAAPSQVDYERLQYAHSELLAEASRASEAADSLKGRF